MPYACKVVVNYLLYVMSRTFLVYVQSEIKSVGFGDDIGIFLIAKFIPSFCPPLCIILVYPIDPLDFSLVATYLA